MRESQQLSQERLAALTGGQPWKVSRPVISAIERGEHLPSFEALLGLSKVLHFDPMEVLERAELAAAPPVDLTDQSLEELEQQAHDMAVSGAYREALAVYDAMLERLVLAPPEDAAVLRVRQARIEGLRSGALYRCGALLSSEAAAKRSILLAEGDSGLQSLAYALLAKVEIARGFLPLARDHAERAVELAQGCDGKAEGRARLGLGNVLLRSERYADARAVFIEARANLRESDDRDHYSHVDGNIGLSAVGLGEQEKARTWFRRALEQARAHSMPILEARWLTELGWLAFGHGRLDEANRYATAAVTIARPRENWLAWFRAEWLRFRIAGKKDASGPDRQRRALLRKLMVHLTDHKAEREIREYRAFVGDDPDSGSGRRGA